MINSWLFFWDFSRVHITCITCGGAPEMVLHGANLSVGKPSSRAQAGTDVPAMWPLSRRLKMELLNPGASRQPCAEAIKPSTQHSWIPEAWRTLCFLHFRTYSACDHVNLTCWMKDTFWKSIQIETFPSNSHPEWAFQRANLGLGQHLRWPELPQPGDSRSTVQKSD